MHFNCHSAVKQSSSIPTTMKMLFFLMPNILNKTVHNCSRSCQQLSLNFEHYDEFS
jgi:hypothetical protein